MPAIRDFAVTEKTTTGTSMVLNMPVHQPGDLLIVFVGSDGTTNVTAPGGIWTNQQDHIGVAQAFRLLTTVATLSTHTLTLTVPADEQHAVVIAVKNVHGVTPVNVSGKRTATDAAMPFGGVTGVSTTAANCLVFHFINSDSGIALTANKPAVNIVNGDVGTAGIGCAYTYQRASGSIPEVTWFGRANDDTTAAVLAVADDGNETEIPAYADATTDGSTVRPLAGVNATNSDTFPASLALAAIGQRDFTKCWAFDGTATYVDETTDINDPGAADVTFNANATNAAIFFGYDHRFACMMLNASTGITVGGGGAVWEYWNGSAWTTLTGPTAPAAGWVRHTWTAPSNWATTSVNGTTLYWIRYRLTGAVTTTPVFSQGHAGGWPTTYDAGASAADTGVNPYMDAQSLSPAQTTNFSGTEQQFGAALDLDTGVLLIYHKSVLARDYAVDPSINDQNYPVTTIEQSRGGFLIVLADATPAYEGYSILGKGSPNIDPVGWNVAGIGLNNGAEPFARIGTLNKSAVTRLLMLPQGENGALSAYVSVMQLISKIVFAGGTSTRPLTFADLKYVANNSVGTGIVIKGVGDSGMIYAPLQIGGGDRCKVNINLAQLFFPPEYDGKKNFDWNADDNVAGIMFFGVDANDSFVFTNCLFSSTKAYRWEFHASHSASAAINFAGSTVVNATVTLRATSDLDSVTFIDCPSFTQNGATLTNCTFDNSKVTAGAPANAALISDSEFISSGTGHAIEISGTAADITLDGLIFTGYAGSNGSTGNEAIYVNIASGSMTIAIAGGGSTPSIRTAGAVVTVVNAVAVKVTAKDADTNSNIEGARVVLYATSGASVSITRSGSTATVSHTAHGFVNGQKVILLGANQGEYNGIKTISNVTPNSYDFAVTGSPATPATGAITAHRVILDGPTNASGVVQDTGFAYTADLAVTGRVRKGTSSTYYKTAPVSGTITTAGFDAIAFLVRD